MNDALWPEARVASRAIEDLASAAWILSAECRAYVEDLEGGSEQPLMQHVATVRLVECWVEVDALMRGAVAPPAEHRFAVALERGLLSPATVTGDAVLDVVGVVSAVAGTMDVGPVLAMWEEILAAYPGAIPNPLVPSGQSDVLRALRQWSTLATRAGTDTSFLVPFMEEA